MKILAITTSRADREPLMPVINALGGHCTHLHLENNGLVPGDILDCDVALLLGDQFWTLRNATEVANRGIPIIHLSGGSLTIGAVDDAFRNAITRLAYWHFPGCEVDAQRLRDSGENPERIFNLGFPAIDALAETLMSKDECEKELGITFESPVALVAYNPETLGSDTGNLLYITSCLQKYKTIIVSGANADKGGDEINEWWQKPDIYYRKTYHQKLWFSLMYHADVLIGNSSGFIYEGMTMGKKFINIGDRQKGRYEDAVEMFKHDPRPFGIPGTVGKAIASKILSLKIPKYPRKV